MRKKSKGRRAQRKPKWHRKSTKVGPNAVEIGQDKRKGGVGSTSRPSIRFWKGSASGTVCPPPVSAWPTSGNSDGLRK
eukprot:2873609-Rhodomonas_salina.1